MILADDLPLCDVIAALGWTMTPPTRGGQHNTYTDPSGWSLTAHVNDVWALLRRRGLIATPASPCCATCGYSVNFPPGWLARYGMPDEPDRPCQCHRLEELPR